MATWALWLACLGLLFLRALMAAAESALYATSEMRAKELVKLYPRSGSRVLRHKTEREATAASLRLGMVVAGFSAAGIGATVPPRILQFRWLQDVPHHALAMALLGALFVGFLASVLDVTMRAAANAHSERWALRLSWLVSLLVFFIYPAIRLLVVVLELLVRPFGGHIRFEAPPPPLEELEKLLAAKAADSQEVDKGAPELIRSIFELSDKRCRDVMVPRTEVVTVEVSSPPQEVLRVLAEENHSRIPVYRNDPDHIVGVLHARDLIPLLQHPELIVLPDVIRPATFVPWVKPIGDLLREMQGKKIHMAVVVDEYGGFMGIVTLEDILREIVGDIGDEFEVEEKLVDKQPDGSFLVDAGMEVGDFAKALGFALPEGEYETLGGFVSSLAGSIPEVGERFSFNGWQFVVQAKAGARLDKIRLMRPKAAAKPAGPGTPGDGADPRSAGSAIAK